MATPRINLDAEFRSLDERPEPDQAGGRFEVRNFVRQIGCRQSHVANVERGRDRFGEWRRRRLHDLIREAA